MRERDVNAEKGLVDCQERDNVNSVNIDDVPKQCPTDDWPTQKRVPTSPKADWELRKTFSKLRIGQSGLCDPMQTGQIINDLDTPDRNVIYRYARGIRAADEAMWDMFRNTLVIDEEGKQHTVPIIWASQEKAVDAILQDNVRKDNSLVVDRIRLPMMSIWNAGIAPDRTRFTYQKAYSLLPWLDPEDEAGFTFQEKFCKDTFFGVTRGLPINISYTLYIWTMYEEDMNQILEQVWLRFSPVAYLQIKGIYWEVIVTLDGAQNNITLEPGDAKKRIIKYQINMTAQSYIPQPIYRLKELPTGPCGANISVTPTFMTEGVNPEFMSEEEIKNTISELKKNIADIEATMNK